MPLLDSGKTTVKINGKERKVSFEKYGRDGSKSPFSIYLWIDGKRRSPYEQDRMGVKLTMSSLFDFYIPKKLLMEEMLKRDWLLKAAPKSDNAWTGDQIVVPFKWAGE